MILNLPEGATFDESYTQSSVKASLGSPLDNLTLLPQWTGHKFAGFYYVKKNQSIDDGIKYFDSEGKFVAKAWDIPSAVTLVAKWEENSYTLTLNTNGGVIDNKFIIDSYIHGQTIFLPSKGQITKESFIFEGWYYNENLTGKSIVSISGEATGNKVFWAKWKKVNRRQHFIGVL